MIRKTIGPIGEQVRRTNRRWTCNIFNSISCIWAIISRKQRRSLCLRRWRWRLVVPFFTYHCCITWCHVELKQRVIEAINIIRDNILNHVGALEPAQKDAMKTIIEIAQDSISQQISSAEEELDVEADLEGIRDLQWIELRSTGQVRRTLTTVRERMQNVCCLPSNPHSIVMLTVSAAFVIISPYSNKALAAGGNVPPVLGAAPHLPCLRLSE